MRKTSKIIITTVLLAMLLLGVGYAALQNITLNISGTAQADPSQSNFKVMFTGTPTVSDASKVTTTVTGDTTAEITVIGLQTEGDTATATYTIKNSSTDMSADLSVSTTNDNTEYFEVIPNLTKESLTQDEETTVTVTVKLAKTPISESQSANIEVSVEATPVEPGQEGSSGSTQTPDDTIQERVAVGDYVTYSTNGSYKWEAQYASSDLTTDGSADITLKNGYGSGTQDMSIDTWRVYSINENTGEIELVPAEPTTEKVRLEGAQGYNNGVKLLNDACSNLYSDSSKGITARSINYEDVINYYDEEIFINYYKQVHVPENYYEIYNYDENFQFNDELIEVSYPKIYEQEDLSVIRYTNTQTETKIEKGAGLARSEQNEFISRTYNNSVNGVSQNAYSFRPFATKRRIKDIDKDSLNLKWDLLFSNADNDYWIATRMLDAWDTSVYFCLYRGTDYGTDNGYLFFENGDSRDSEFALFPIVSLNVNLLETGSSTKWKVK